MASIIKNQIIKHLSAFARNLKPEQISVEVLRGKGQLRNLELNEEVLAERLELPPWLKIVRAHCTSVSVNIPWTKLRSVPVELFVEEIQVTIRLVASAIPRTRKSGLATGKPYDLAERVIEGISMNVQSIEILFETDSQSNINFAGSIMMSQFILQSRKPNWKEWEEKNININMTRIHDKTVRQLLFFKHITWRVLKIEASANFKSEDYAQSAGHSHRSSLNSPLRFLTENGRCQITIKKNTLDCSLIAGRIELFLQEIHWLAYMAHLRSAIDFYKHILDLANSVGKDPSSLMKQQQQPGMLSSPIPSSNSLQSNSFRQLDIPQSSHHLTINRIDLHLCDDSSMNDLPTDWSIESGAMQAIIHKLRVDFYPQHRVFEPSGEFSTRSTWLQYSSPNQFTDLAKMQLDQHFRKIINKIEPNSRDRFVRIWPQLISKNVIIRIDNLMLQSVSERSTKKEALRYIFSMNKREKDKLPKNISFIHLEFSGYNFPATNSYPVPFDSIHLMLAPFELAPDPKSIRWIVYALENILNSLDAPQIVGTNHMENQPIDIRIQLIMPKIVLLPNDLPSSFPISSVASTPQTFQKRQHSAIVDSRLPRRFLAHATTVFLSNFTLLNDPLVPMPFMFKNRARNEDHLEFIKWAESRDESSSKKENQNEGFLMEHLKKRSSNFDEPSLLERPTRTDQQEWFISIPSLWMNSDFGTDTWELPLLVDLAIFGCIASEKNDKSGNSILFEPHTDIGITVDHFQFVQFIELIDRIGALMDQITSDRLFFRKHLTNLPNDLPAHFFFQCDKVHLRLILPPGPTPSPYDQKWFENIDLISPSNTSISCSAHNHYTIDLPNDETVISSSGAFTNSMKKHIPSSIHSTKGSSSALADTFAQQQQILPDIMAPSTTLTAETIGGLSVQGGMKTVESLGEVSQIAVTGKMPLEMQVSRKQLIGTANLPDYTNPTPSDLESNFDDTLSITTSTSAENLGFDTLVMGETDSIVEAEEALESDEQQRQQEDIRILRHREKYLGGEVNVFDILLEDLNVHAKAAEGRTTAMGFATNISVGERLRLNCGNVYAEKGATFESSSSSLGELKMEDPLQKRTIINNLVGVGNPMEKAKLKLEMHSALRQNLIKLDINGINICLSDEIVSQLSPFIQNQTEDENPSALELSLHQCKIEIKDPKKRFPLRIRLGELSIQDGPGREKLCE